MNTHLHQATPLALFWFLIMGALGVFFPYYGLYLRENVGLDGFQVGVVFATLPLVGFFVQPLWGIVADRSGLRIRVLAVLASGSAAGYFLLGCVESFLALVCITVLFAFFSRALIPMTVSVSLAVLQGSQHAFGIIRAFGTLGFFCAVLGFPWLLAALPPLAVFQTTALSLPSEPQLGILFPLAAGLTLCAAVSAITLPHRGPVALRALQGEWRSLLSQGPFLRLTLVGFLAFFFLHGPMDIFPIYIRDRGGDIETIRNMWCVMLVPEIIFMTLLGTSVRRLGARGLLAVGIGAGAFRWLFLSQVTALPLLYPVQVLHALTVTGLFLGGPLYLEATIPPQLRSTGQALFSMISMGLGGGCSSLMTGALLEQAGINAPYLVGGAGALLLALLLPSLLPSLHPSPLSQDHG